jgi:hypothetical protein
VVLLVNLVNSVNSTNKLKLKHALACLQRFTLFTLILVKTPIVGILKKIIFCNNVVAAEQVRLQT